jgi:hypothetical protein
VVFWVSGCRQASPVVGYENGIEWVVQLTISSYVNAFDGSLTGNFFFEEGAGSLTPGQNWKPQCAAPGLPRQHRGSI